MAAIKQLNVSIHRSGLQVINEKFEAIFDRSPSEISHIINHVIILILI